MTRTVYRNLAAAALASAFLALAGGTTGPAWAEATVPATVSPAIPNYTRIADDVGTAGRLGEGAIGELKAAGFVAVLDLRGPDEGTDAERRAVEAAGLRYFNIPVTTILPTREQVVEFARLVDDRANRPILIHCASANRVGEMWALHRAVQGAPAATALAEGRRIGMRGEREAAVAAVLGLR